MKTLVVVDMQNDFVTGSLGTKEAQAIVPNVKARVESGEFEDIFYTKDTHYSNYLTSTLEGKKLPVEHCIKNTIGWDIIPELQTEGFIAEKETFGSLEMLDDFIYYSGFPDAGDEIEICGLCTDICVVSNALLIRAKFPNLKIIVRANCCAGSTPELHEAALKVMESCQIDVIR